MRYLFMLILSAGLLCGTAQADCLISYSDFEEEITHLDIDACPADFSLSAADGFCRLVLQGEQAVIYSFIFAEDDACLAGSRTYALQDLLTKR